MSEGIQKGLSPSTPAADQRSKEERAKNASPIENLPIDVPLCIFDHLDADSLMNFAKSSPAFWALFSSYPSFLRKWKLHDVEGRAHHPFGLIADGIPYDDSREEDREFWDRTMRLDLFVRRHQLAQDTSDFSVERLREDFKFVQTRVRRVAEEKRAAAEASAGKK